MEKYNFEFNSTKSKYIQIYAHIKKIIENTTLKTNEKLPPIRKLADFLLVNTSTIVKSYELLEKEGYIYKIAGSGTFVSNINKLEDNMPKANDICVHFDNGNPSIGMFPIEDFKNAINMALINEGASIFEYDDGLGFIKLRQKIVNYVKRQKINTSQNNIQIISGAQQGIDIVAKSLINYSDIVFVEEPTYSGALEVFKARGAKIISIPMLEDGIDIGILKMKLEKLRPKLFYVMPNFQNPTGISYSKYKKQKLIELAEEYNFYILEDDFMSDFKFNSDDNLSLRAYDDKGRVIYIKSFSKLLMPGLRIGFIEMPNEILKKILWAKYSTDISTSGLIQRSMFYYMDKFNWDYYINNIEKIYKEKFDLCLYLIQTKLIDKLKYIKPSGGINFFLELPRGYSSKDFKNYLLKKGVSIIPGTHFFDNIVDDRYFRINIASLSLEEIEIGISIIEDNLEIFLKKYKNHLDFKESKFEEFIN